MTLECCLYALQAHNLSIDSHIQAGVFLLSSSHAFPLRCNHL